MDGFDPAALCRLRDGVYAPDLLVTAVAELDVFSWLVRAGPVTSEQLCNGLGLAPRPAGVCVTDADRPTFDPRRRRGTTALTCCTVW